MSSRTGNAQTSWAVAVKYWKRENDVYIYEDPVLRSEEEKDYLIRIEENKRSRNI